MPSTLYEEVFDAFRAVCGASPYRVKFLIEGEEEIGSLHLHDFIRDHRDLLADDACVWEAGGVDYEGRPAVLLDLRGVVCVELRLRTMNSDAHSGEQSYLPNAAWRLIWALSTLKDQHERILIPGFYDTVRRPTARQRELLAAMPSGEEEEKHYYGISRFAGGLYRKSLEGVHVFAYLRIEIPEQKKGRLIKYEHDGKAFSPLTKHIPSCYHLYRW
jgi:acetylornithine deacetylase/succinyl-diaminopimelate desuccinylase-like protein